MGKSAPSPPPPPDPVRTAQAQGQMNRETAITQFGLNAVNQRTPQGSLQYNQIGTWQDGTPRFEAVQTLSPAQQRQLEMTEQAQDIYGQAALSQLGQVRERLSQPFQADFSGIGDGGTAREDVQNALMARMRPQLDQTRTQLETRLRNQGLMPGSDAWNAAMRDVGQQENDATMAAILSAGQEQNRILGARQMSLQEQMALRAQPTNEAAALLTGQQIQQPQFTATPQTGVQTPDFQGAVRDQYAGQMAAWQAQQNARNATLGGLFGLGGAALGGWMRSDARVKRDARRIGTTGAGLPIYVFRYADDPGGAWHMGVMAQDVEAVSPDAVREIDGVKHVNLEAVA